MCALFDVPTRFVLYLVSTNLQWVPLEMWKMNKFTLGIILNEKVSWSFFKTHFQLLGVEITITQVSFLKINFRKYRAVENIWRK